MTGIFVGDYFIKVFDFKDTLPTKEENIWIQCNDGEGMEVPVKKFNELMRQFFKENM